MIPTPNGIKTYHSAKKRFIKPAIENFFKTEFPTTFGPNIRSIIADKLIQIFQANYKDINSVKPGQILWNVVHKDTRADSPNMKLVPVVLTIVDQDDINRLEKGVSMAKNRGKVIARITREAYQQGGLLSMRDIGLLLTIELTIICKNRINYERQDNKLLPHTGNLHDMGSTLTHKYQIIYKYVIEKKDLTNIVKETNHSIKAVEHYLKDFNRVKTLYLDNKGPEYIKVVTSLSLNVISQYINIIEKYGINRKAS